MSACRAAEYDCVDDALDRSPSATQSSMPPTRRRRRRRPFVLGDAPCCRRATIYCRGVTRRRAAARAVVPTTRGRTGRVRRRPPRELPFPILNGADLGGSAAPPRIGTSRYPPLRGAALVTNPRPPQKGVSYVCATARPAPSARALVTGRGQRRHSCPSRRAIRLRRRRP